MQKSFDVHCFERNLVKILKNLKDSDICDANKRSILEFYGFCLNDGFSLGRIVKVVVVLHRIAKMLQKPFSEATKDDIVKLVSNIESKNYSDWTKRDYKIILRRFYKWLKNSEDYPEEVRWIKTRIKNKNLLPQELLTEEELMKMVEAADNLRDKALVFVLYDSGCRISEILSLRIRNVQFDEHGAVLTVNGKTGMRRVRTIPSVPSLATYLANHPSRENIDSPLWINLGTKNRGSYLTYRQAESVLKVLARKVGIKKRVYAHLFRHSRATSLASHLTEAQMKQHFGWVQGSRMAAVYVHLSGRDVDPTLLKLHGIEVQEAEQETKLKVVLCPRCEQRNSPTSKFCCRCGVPLDVKTAVEFDEARAKVDRLLDKLTEDPEKLEKLLTLVETV